MTADEPLKVGDRVRLSAKADDSRRAAIGTGHGTVESIREFYADVQWDIPNPEWDAPDLEEIERIDPEPTPEPTVAVPVPLIEDLLEHTLNDRARAELEGLLSKPTPRRLRVVDLDELQVSAGGAGRYVHMSDLEAAPDVLAIVEQAIVREAAEDRAFTADVPHMVARIRAALEEAVDRG